MTDPHSHAAPSTNPESDGEPKAVSVAWWLWPQVLCLDAPLVAMAWMAALAKSHHLRLQPSFYIGLGLVTWIVYVLDRTADAVSGRLQAPLSARHEFCLRHQKLLLRVLVPLAATFVTPLPPMLGFAFALVRANTMPRSVIAAPLSAVMLPPSVAVVARRSVLVGSSASTGARAARVTPIV